MAKLLTIRVRHSQDDWEYDNLIEGLDQQEASVYVLSAEPVEPDEEEIEGEVTGVTLLKVRVQAEEDYQYSNVEEEIDQSEAYAHIIHEEEVPDEED